MNKFLAFYETRKLITAFTKARQLSLSIQSKPPQSKSWRQILILCFHRHLGLPKGLFPLCFPHQNCNHITLDKCPGEFSDFSRVLQPPPVIKAVSSFRNHKVHLRRQCHHILPPIINSSCFIFYFLYWITVEKVFLPSFLPRWRLRLTWCTTSRFRFLNTVFNKNWAVARSIETASAAVTTTSTTTTQIHTLHICPKRDPNPRSQCYNSTRLRPHNHCRHGLLFLTSHAQRFIYTANYTLSDDKSTTDSAMYTRNRNSSPKYDMCKLTCCNITCP